MHAKFGLECGANSVQNQKSRETNKIGAKQRQPLHKLEVGSDAMKEWASSANKSNPQCALCHFCQNGKKS